MDEFKQTNFSNEEETERQFMLTSVGDIQKLHCILENLNNNIRYLTAEQKKLGIKKEPEKPIPIKEPEEYNFKGEVLSSIFSGTIKIMLIGWIFLPLGLAAVVIHAIYRVIEGTGKKREYEQRLENYKETSVEYEKELNKYEKELGEIEVKYKKETTVAIPNLTKAIKKLSDERDEALKILNECYDLNVIPSKYRNIYAITFLYDYLSTSKCSLRDALLACDLDKIQMQLDSIIENQRNMICRLAKIEANSEKQIKQQELMINQLKNIEKNTYDTARASELCAKYSQIISHDVKVAAYCSAMTYIDNRDISKFDYFSPMTIEDFGFKRLENFREV